MRGVDRDDDTAMELALASIFAYKPKVALAIREEFSSLADFFNLSGRELLSVKGITQEQVERIKSAGYIETFYDEIEWCRRYGIEIVRYDKLPTRLKEIHDPPFLLFCKGNKELLYAEHSISVVGTRLATDYGRTACNSIMSAMSGTGLNVVIYSGLAYGIDAAAHAMAMSNSLKTVAVLPNGLDKIYPDRHRELAVEIVRKGGLLVTEFLRGTKPLKVNFIKRNRLIASLTPATIVVESRVKGGAMLTAEFAVGYGRELFAVPGRINDVNSYGCNYLISRSAAIILNTPQKIPSELGWNVKNMSPIFEVEGQTSLFAGDSKLKLKILSLLNRRSATLIDYICTAAGASVDDVSAALVGLQIEGAVDLKDDGYILT